MLIQSLVAGPGSNGALNNGAGWFPPDALPSTSTPDPPMTPAEQDAELNKIFAQMAEEAQRRRIHRDQLVDQARSDSEKAQEEARLRSIALQQSMSGLWYSSFRPAPAAAAPAPPPPPPPPPAKKK